MCIGAVALAGIHTHATNLHRTMVTTVVATGPDLRAPPRGPSIQSCGPGTEIRRMGIFTLIYYFKYNTLQARAGGSGLGPHTSGLAPHASGAWRPSGGGARRSECGAPGPWVIQRPTAEQGILPRHGRGRGAGRGGQGDGGFRDVQMTNVARGVGTMVQRSTTSE